MAEDQDVEVTEAPSERPARRRRDANGWDAPEAVNEEEAQVATAVATEDPEVEVVRQESPYDRPGSWYVVHTYAGYENKVKSNLESRISSMNMEDRIYEVVIPMEEVMEVKNGKRVSVQRKV